MLLKKNQKTKKILVEKSSDSDNSSESDAYSTDSMRDPALKQKTRNEMKSQRNKKSIIKVHEREPLVFSKKKTNATSNPSGFDEQTTKQQNDFNPLLFFI